MDTLHNLGIGLTSALQPGNLVFCLVGVSLGTLVGVIPGIGSLAAIAMLLPITYYLEPTAALVMLAGVYYGTDYGGSIAAILLRLPGSASSAITCIDGYAMTQRGRAGTALISTALASFVGGSFGIVLLMVLAPLFTEIALVFGSAEYFALMVLGLVACSSIAQGSALKGLAMVLLGLLLGSSGVDVNSGLSRFNFGVLELYDGLSIVLLAMAMFGVCEIITSADAEPGHLQQKKLSLKSMVLTRSDVQRSVLPVARGSAIGSLVGVLPGAGGSIASFLSYAIEKRVSRQPEIFGRGAIEGVTAPEAANNAAAQTSFIPTLTMGIPGSAGMALIMGAMLIHGINPGAGLMTSHPAIFWSLVASFWIGNLFLLLLNIPIVGLWVRLLQVPYQVLFPTVLCVICVGVYSINSSIFDLYVLMGLASAGYFLRLFGFEPAPLLVGFVLGPLLEENFRRAMMLGRGDPIRLVEGPITSTLLLIALVLVVLPVVSFVRRRSWADSGA